MTNFLTKEERDSWHQWLEKNQPRFKKRTRQDYIRVGERKKVGDYVVLELDELMENIKKADSE